MTDNRDFDDQDDDIFSDKDISHDSPSKGNRIIPTWLMGDFMAWLGRYHPEILMIWNVSQHDLDRLIKEFEYFAQRRYDFTVQEWQHDLRNR